MEGMEIPGSSPKQLKKGGEPNLIFPLTDSGAGCFCFAASPAGSPDPP